MIVVGVGPAAISEPAFEFAATEAEKAGCDLSLLTVHATSEAVVTPTVTAREQAIALEHAAAELRTQHPKLPITRSIVSGSISAAFAHASYRARMIVLGAPDSTRPGSVSTFEEIVSASSVPVAVVRAVSTTRVTEHPRHVAVPI